MHKLLTCLPKSDLPSQKSALGVAPFAARLLFILVLFTICPKLLAQNTLVTTIAGGQRNVDSTYLASQFRNPFGIARSSRTGEVFVADERNFNIRLLKDGQVYTLAGSPDRQSGVGDGQFFSARFSGPRSICLSPSNDTLYIADGGGNRDSRVRALIVAGPDSGTVFTLAGNTGSNPNPRNGLSGDAARFNGPGGLIYYHGYLLYSEDAAAGQSKIRSIQIAAPHSVGTLGDSGFHTSYARGFSFLNASGMAAVGPDSLYVASAGRNRIYKISIANAGIDSLAGTGAGSNINGPFATATFKNPRGLAYDATARLLYVSEEANHGIRTLNFNTHMVSGLAGSTANVSGYVDTVGKLARFNRPISITLSDSLLYVADYYNARVRTVATSSGRVRTLAGSRAYINGPARLNVFEGGAIAPYKNGSILIVDRNTHTLRLLTKDGNVQTLAGSGQSGRSTDSSTLATAVFNQPSDLTVHGDTVYLVDDGNDRLMRLNLVAGTARAFNGITANKIVAWRDTALILTSRVDNRVMMFNPVTRKLRNFAANGGAGAKDGSPDSAQIRQPGDGAIWHDTLYISSGSGSNLAMQIRSIPLLGPQAGYTYSRYTNTQYGLNLNNPGDVLIDDQGILYINNQAYSHGVPRISLVDNSRPTIRQYFLNVALPAEGPVAQVGSGKNLSFALDSSGNGLLVLDADNGVIRLISPLHTVVATKPINIAKQTLSLFPNPTTGQVQVWIDAAQAHQVPLAVYDMLGKLVARQTVAVQNGIAIVTFNLHGQPRGVYIIKAFEGSHALMKRCVLE